jgi:phage terminase large subunit-like protein
VTARAYIAEDEAQEDVRPQTGPQEQMLACRADIAIMGGSVYGGKSWALTVGPTRHVGTAGFTCTTFRRTKPDIRNQGSLWDESLKWYPDFQGRPREQMLEWEFPSGASVKFDGLQHEQDVLGFKSAQITLIQFDQLEEFTAYQFWYMQSRNRNPYRNGIRAYCRASCNALAELLQWWWNPATGYAIRERSNLARWLLRIGDEIHWSDIACAGDAPLEVWERAQAQARSEFEARFPGKGRYATSLCFIRASIADNRIGVETDPEYESRVRLLPLVEQERLLGGNWKIRAAAGLVFDRAWFEIVEAVPVAVVRRVRYWDKAGTKGAGDWSVGVRMSQGVDGILYVEDVIRGQWHAGEREYVIEQAASIDGHLTAPKLLPALRMDRREGFLKVAPDPRNTIVGVEQEPGSGGKDMARYTVINLAGVSAYADHPTGDLIERAGPLAAQAQVGNVKLLRAAWNGSFLAELHAFPTDGIPDDQVSASAGALKLLRFGKLPTTAPTYATAKGKA